MKIKLLYSLLLIALTSFVSCKKEDKPAPIPVNSTTINIGDKDYSIVKIGNQNWTGINYSGAGGAYFNENDPKTEYGKLYTYAEAIAITPPTGWRLPTKDDYLNLLQGLEITVTDDRSTSADAIKKLQSITGWSAGHQGTNISKFNALPTGFFANGIFNAEGDVTILWTSTKTADKPYFLSISKAELAFYNEAVTTQKFSVRFVKSN